MSVSIPAHMSRCPMHGALPAPDVIATRKGRSEITISSWPGATHQTQWVPEGFEPDFGKYDDEKLRQCIAGRYCHVCTRPNPPVPLICVPKHRRAGELQTIQLGARAVPMVTQPWVCTECLKFAASHCPPLRTAIEERRGLVAFVIEHRLVSTMWKPAEPGDPIPPPRSTVLSFIKVALVRARYMPLHEWARRFAR